MTKPNFQEMSREELKKYIRTHPTDDDAIRELFVNRRNPNAKRYPYPYDMPEVEVRDIFQKKLDRC
ncbi:hypothetical protein C7B64_05100 [Merismopedia glauca CCAP 1448/3]|uniref:Uncharacterized protein n=2 Tax=Merismopedia TaxID=53402 RepID=A0A2T1C7W1_9CYAN|nr:hypothetical protein C7B64_05100 [Merismopedia glauca CCAP 1448/3]